jgi:predicted nuclease of restriction endonuclease-like (RecB) superfamily
MQNFEQLSISINNLHAGLKRTVLLSANRMHTVRNWLIGQYIVVYEQNGEDRAKYGIALLANLSESLKNRGMRGMSVSSLRDCRQFFLCYPQLHSSIVQIASTCRDCAIQIHQTVSGEFEPYENQSVTAYNPEPDELLQHFSFSHFVELMRINDLLKRSFYETEGIQGNWSLSQLKRQIESLLFERTGLSKDKKGLVEAVHAQNQKMCVDDIIRDPYILEFTGFPEPYQFSENDLENSLLDHIQAFLLELGNGFCFEARQKRITLDNEHDRIDLVFYHRILRCHILIDLKVRKFTPGDAGQMNFYLNYYRENIMTEEDNPPIGLILCTDRDETRVKYATAGLDNQLYISKYLTQLPSADTLREFLEGDRERTIMRLQEQRARYGDENGSTRGE